MGKTSTNRPAIPAVDALDRWFAHRRGPAAAPAPAVPPAGPPSGPPSGPPTGPPTQVQRHVPDATEAGRAIVDALAAAPAAPTTSTIVPQPEHSSPRTLGAAAGAAPSEVQPPKGVANPPRATIPATATVPASAAAEDDVITFAPKHGARRVLAVALGASALATVGAGLLAWRSGTDTAYAVVVAAAAATVVVWALFGRSTTTQVSIHHGQLRVVQGASQHRFPLTAAYPAIDVLGAPGDRGWKVLVQRKGMGPYEITPSMVDPAEFTAALRRFRPDA